MAITNGYLTLEAYKDREDIQDDQDDAALESIIEGISRFIDNECWRRFYSSNETRYFTAQDSKLLDVFDITSIDNLKTDSAADRTYAETWAVTDYDLLPFNAVLDGEPYTQIQVAPNGDYSFPVGLAKGVQIKGDFGYVGSGGDPPAGIVEATYLGVNRVVARGSTPLGVSASAALGEMSVVVKELQTDPDFKNMISFYKLRA